MLKVKRNGESLGIYAFEKLGSRISRLGIESWPTLVYPQTPYSKGEEYLAVQ
jgi:hypothetical protein